MIETQKAPFDLMRDKPPLDIPTLNWVWDALWRYNACNRRQNREQRDMGRETERIMRMIEDEARAVLAKAEGATT